MVIFYGYYWLNPVESTCLSHSLSGGRQIRKCILPALNKKEKRDKKYRVRLCKNGMLLILYGYCLGDKDDIMRYADRILARALTVDVAVRTDRDAQQEEALHQVCILIHITFNYTD